MGLRTERDYEEHVVTQLAVFLSNRVGGLRDILKKLGGASVVVHAFTIDESVDYAVLNLVVDRVDAAKQTLAGAGFAVTEGTVLAIELADEQGGLLSACQALLGGEVNIHDAYPMLTRPHGKPVVVMHVDSVPTAANLLRAAGITLLDQRDLAVA